MPGPKSRLSEQEWQDVAEYYLEGHTLRECEVIYGVSYVTISIRFKKMGVKTRRALEPRTEEKALKMDSIAHVPEKWREAYRKKAPRKEGSEEPIGGKQIVKLSKEDRDFYEKEIE